MKQVEITCGQAYTYKCNRYLTVIALYSSRVFDKMNNVCLALGIDPWLIAMRVSVLGQHHRLAYKIFPPRCTFRRYQLKVSWTYQENAN